MRHDPRARLSPGLSKSRPVLNPAPIDRRGGSLMFHSHFTFRGTWFAYLRPERTCVFTHAFTFIGTFIMIVGVLLVCHHGEGPSHYI